MTPARRAASSKEQILLAAPRTLNEPVGCRCSHFRSTSHPSEADNTGLTSNAVTGTWGLMATSASRIRSNRDVIEKSRYPSPYSRGQISMPGIGYAALKTADLALTWRPHERSALERNSQSD